ncbi:hypothetical protein DSCOOX_21640 [Desulfosarcina ovata subsp. ovata]|uniref:Uncharacterized protein n=1 Tax=Desulfosarcina ovata subsp. ovata TaxID=2752305 RepID=A0A5K8A9Y6_9BACT|nr:hypothetical protein DSCOOX_21640 [Desulfosarcina ovata subsp. ovata]
MPTSKMQRQDIPTSNNNTLYYVDRSFVRFAQKFDPSENYCRQSTQDNCSTTVNIINNSSENTQSSS